MLPYSHCFGNYYMKSRLYYHTFILLYEQTLRIGFFRIVKNIFCLPYFNHSSILHNHDTVAHMINYIDIMGYEQI